MLASHTLQDLPRNRTARARFDHNTIQAGYHEWVTGLALLLSAASKVTVTFDLGTRIRLMSALC
jgi:hypothetical protein